MADAPISRERDTRDVSAQQDDHVRTQQVGSCLQTKERGLRRSQPCRHLDLKLLASRIVKGYISIL